MTSQEIVERAAEFWERSGSSPPFPRDLEPVVLLGTPLVVISLAELAPSTIVRWLSRRGIRFPLRLEDRPLDGCIVAWRGRVMIFLEKHLGPEDRRVILAH